MRVALMSDVKDKFIFRKIEHVIKRDGGFYYSEIRRKMPAVFFNDGNYTLS